MKPSTRKNNHLFAPAIAAGIIMAGSTAQAAVLVVGVGANSTIRASATNQGISQLLFAGDTTNADDFLRSAVAFDLSNPLLTGATINSATVTFFSRESDGTSQSTTITLNLHQLTSSFTNGGVTWTSRNGTDNWTNAGGDFGGVLASASGNPRTIGVNTSMAFSSASLATAVDGAVGGTLNLLLKSNTEDTTTRNIFQFASTRNVLNAATGPTLTIDYTPIPEPSAALLGSLGLLALLRRRR